MLINTFSDIVESIDSLDKEELKEIKRYLDQKLLMINHKELVEAVKQARKDREEGKAITLATPEEIKDWFSKLIENNEDRF